MNLANCTINDWKDNEASIKQQLQDKSVWNSIPLLNVNDVQNLSDSQLVRFRGMVQDMHGPEYYLEKYKIVNNTTNESRIAEGKYRDIVHCSDNETVDYESPESVKSERQSFVVISTPALNDWVKSYETEKYKLKTTSTGAKSGQAPKRELENDEEMETESSQQNKRLCTQEKPPNCGAISKEYLLNFPIEDPAGKSCHLKLYQEISISLNDIVDFVGFLSVSPLLASNSADEMDDEEFQAHNPPPSLIPRIHCVDIRVLKHNNPLLDEIDQFDFTNVDYVRKELLILLTQLFLGDVLAAEYFLFNLISEVYLRRDGLALGKFALNVSNIPKFENIDYVSELYKFLALLTEKSHYLAMTLDNMNELAFIPKKDYTTNRLSSSILQLTKNTHLLLDETKLTAGSLNAAGVKGVQAIAEAIKHQRANYDFTYYQIDFNCDIPFLVFSEGKSMLPSDSHVVLQPDELHLATFSEIVDAAKHFLKPELLRNIRLYLSGVKLVAYTLSDNIEKMVQEAFVKMRQAGAVTGEDLHALLVLARLVCISRGKSTLDEECWNVALKLEEKRKKRLK